MKPALTAEEWAALNPNWFQEGRFSGDNYMTYDQRHEMAAKCLQYMPFGFTRDDVRELRETAESSVPSFSVDERNAVLSIADRIEALLPPEDK